MMDVYAANGNWQSVFLVAVVVLCSIGLLIGELQRNGKATVANHGWWAGGVGVATL
jgi:hypothetical protein